MIKVSNLNKYYNRGRKNENHVLKDINLEFENTGLVCILGESGCGKTTLLNTIGGLDDFYNGNLTVGDTSVSKYNLKAAEKYRNDNLGFVFQNYYLLMDYTVAYNVKLALNIYDLSEEEKDERVNYTLEALGMMKYRKKLVSELSGGQQQRVSIARALVKSPRIILADEPTGNLDEENTIRTMSVLKNISKECLVIVVTHEKDIAKFFADRIIKIKDGEVYKDYKNVRKDSYIRKYDSNIYLKELQEHSTELNELNIKLYGDINNTGGMLDDDEVENVSKIVDTDKVSLSFAFKDGKLYIKNDSKIDVILTSEEDDCQLIDDYMPALEVKDVENFEYKLDPLKSSRRGHFTFHDIRKLAHENLKLIGKKQVFIIVILLLTSVLMTVGVANFVNKLTVPMLDVVTMDSRYVQVSMKTTGKYEEGPTISKIDSYMDDILRDGKYVEIYPLNKIAIDITYDNVTQMKSMTGHIENVSFVSYNHLHKDQIIEGEMADSPDEVVIDEWVVQKFIKDNSVLSEVLTSNASFLNQKLHDMLSAKEFTIVGIARSEEPTIYVNDIVMGIVGNRGIQAASTEQMEKYYPKEFKEYKDLELDLDDAIVNSGYYEAASKDKRIHHDGGGHEHIMIQTTDFEIKRHMDMNFGADVIVSNERYNMIKYGQIKGSRSFIVYANDKTDEIIAYMKKMGEPYKKYFKVNAEVTYYKQLKEYNRRALSDVNFATFITIGIFIISLIMIYFMIKSNAVARSEELTVYRLIGISRFSILKTYMLEITILTLYVCIPTILVTTIVIKFVSSIPSLQLSLTFPWWTSLALMASLLLINNIISIMPVYGIISKPPAKLAIKE